MGRERDPDRDRVTDDSLG